MKLKKNCNVKKTNIFKKVCDVSVKFLNHESHDHLPTYKKNYIQDGGSYIVGQNF